MERLTLDQIYSDLNQRIQNALDNEKAEYAVYDAFIEEYKKGISGSPEVTKETHKRSLQLYDFTMRGQDRARDYRYTAQLFQSILQHLAQLQAKVQVAEERIAELER